MHSEAIRCYEESLTIARDIGDQARVAGALNNLGLVKGELGLYKEARVHLEESLHMTREMGRRAGMASALNNLGRLAQKQGEHEEAQRLYGEAMTISPAREATTLLPHPTVHVEITPTGPRVDSTPGLLGSMDTRGSVSTQPAHVRFVMYDSHGAIIAGAELSTSMEIEIRRGIYTNPALR